MKKFISMLLAIILTFSCSTVAFAYDNVDNTFDNFIPGTDKVAPENWYDPWIYDTDGTINTYASDFYYCKVHQKVFVLGPVKNEKTGKVYSPYETLIDGNEFSCTYCPYCGIDLPSAPSQHTRIYFDGLAVYGLKCEICNRFVGTKHFIYEMESLNCPVCDHDNPVENSVIYRAVSSEAYNCECSFVFEESAYKWGEGKDLCYEFLTAGGWYVYEANPGDGSIIDKPYSKLTFWEKIVAFFKKIFNAIANIFN